MKAFTAAMYGLMTGSAFETTIGGRLYEGRAPQNPTAPYAIYHIIAPTPDRTFSEDMTDLTLQFSIFSQASDQTEILDAGKNLIDLYDKATIAASGWKQIFIEYASGEGEVIDFPKDTIAGTDAYFQNDIDFHVKLSRS